MVDTPDNRSVARQRTLKGARIVFNGGRSTLDCTLRNTSSDGAKLQVSSVVGVPNTFDLMVVGQPTRGCRVVWRALNELGVTFNA